MAKILVVEGDSRVLCQLGERLAQDGHAVSQASDVSESLRILSEESCEIGIVDLDICDNSGEPVLKAIRAHPSGGRIPVIATVRGGPRELLTQAWEQEICAVLSKPFSLSLLSRKVSLVLKPPRRNAALDPASVRVLLSAASHVFHRSAGVSLEPGKPFLKTNSRGLSDFSAMIRFSHRAFDGYMAVSLDGVLLHRVLGAFLGAERASHDVEALKDCCGELANQILGRAKHLFLSERGLDFEMGVPSVLHGRDHVVQFPSESGVLVIPFSCGEHRVFVELCTSDSEEAQISGSPKTTAAKEGELLLF